MIATEEGYLAELDVFMDTVTLLSSLNDICLLEATSCSVKKHVKTSFASAYIRYSYRLLCLRRWTGTASVYGLST